MQKGDNKPSLKERIIRLLEEKNYSELLEVAEREQGIFRTLLSLTYDKEDLICWRAIESVGLIAGEIAKTDPGIVRNLAGRLLWSIREESGGIGWSAPEILGEIVRNSPDEFSDLVPIIASFHEENMLRCGVFRAIVRIAEVRPDLAKSSSTFIKLYLRHEDALVRAYAVMLTGRLGLKEYTAEIEMHLGDSNVIKIYEKGDFKISTVGQIAEQTVIILQKM